KPRARAALLAAQQADQPAVALGRPAILDVLRRLGRQASHFCRALAGKNAFGGFFIKQPARVRRPAHRRQRPHLHVHGRVHVAYGYQVVDGDVASRLSGLIIDQHASFADFLNSQAARLIEARRPQPPIQSHLVCHDVDSSGYGGPPAYGGWAGAGTFPARVGQGRSPVFHDAQPRRRSCIAAPPRRRSLVLIFLQPDATHYPARAPVAADCAVTSSTRPLQRKNARQNQAWRQSHEPIWPTETARPRTYGASRLQDRLVLSASVAGRRSSQT